MGTLTFMRIAPSSKIWLWGLPLLSFFLFLPLSELWRGIFIWIAFVPLFIFVLKNPRPFSDFLLMLGITIGFWGIGIFAVFEAYGAEMYSKLLLAAALPFALFVGIFSLVANATSDRLTSFQRVLQVLFPGTLWVSWMMVLRGTEIDSFMLEVVFYQPLPLMQIAVLGNVDLLVFLILTINSSLAFFLVERRKEYAAVFFLTMFCVCGIWIWGSWRLQNHPPQEGNTSIALIQTNFPLAMEWRTENANLITTKYREWGKQAAENGATIIFFPAYNLSKVMNYEDTIEFFASIARETQTQIVTSTYSDVTTNEQGDEGQYNIGLSVTSTGMLLPIYITSSSIPFREVGQLFTEQYTPIETPAGEAGLMLCFDDGPRHVSHIWKRMGVDYLVILTNPSTFAGDIIMSYNLASDRLHAIETGKEIVRVTANGPSGVVDRFGRYRAITQYEDQTILMTTVSGGVGSDE